MPMNSSGPYCSAKMYLEKLSWEGDVELKVLQVN
jgi:hypothetical protein